MNIQRIILENLRRRHPGLQPTNALWSECLLDEPQATYTAYKAALTELEQLGEIVVIAGADRTKAKITDAGLARLAE